MRLLQRRGDGSYQLTKNFLDDDVPSYAILSHTWGAEDDEVTFEEISQSSGRDKVGYDKLDFCGTQAALDDLQYFWVDSCCIKKSSDAELSEALNSMFRWYRRAAKCYVYLSDVSTRNGEEKEDSLLRTSRWFTRGFTLQELLAPRKVEFYSKEWKLLGDKISLRKLINEITGIPLAALTGTPLSSFSVEERMKWTKGRKTTRKEDGAYCLLGIFGVFISPIYGEGDNAFVRLEEAISKKPMKKSLEGRLFSV